MCLRQAFPPADLQRKDSKAVGALLYVEKFAYNRVVEFRYTPVVGFRHTARESYWVRFWKCSIALRRSSCIPLRLSLTRMRAK